MILLITEKLPRYVEAQPYDIQVLTPMAWSYPGHSVLTEDKGMIVGEDDCPCGRKGKYFKVFGRIKNAEIRGCSDTYTTPLVPKVPKK